jgi:hypothetical protein
MASTDRIFVSPGVFTSEKDLTFVTRQVGVTTLGLVGETPKGPAFEPVFISDYDEFQKYFGGLNSEKFAGSGFHKYETNYIAKSYLSQTNQLYVTRVLGLSGYKAGSAWVLTLDADLDDSTVTETISATTHNLLLTYTADTAGNPTNLVWATPPYIIEDLYNDGEFTINGIGNLSVGGQVINQTTPIYVKNETNNTFSGASFDMYVVTSGSSGGLITGTTSGTVTTYSGTGYTDVENTVVATLRSRGVYDSTEQLLLNVTGTTTVGISGTDMIKDPLASFTLTGTNRDNETFSYNVSFDNTKKNYIPKVLGVKSQDREAEIWVEEIYKNTLDDQNAEGKIRGINTQVIQINNSGADNLDNYNEEYQSAVTPYVLSELRGSKLYRLFRLITISDGNAANEDIKISIINIKPDDKTFDLVIRKFYDDDARPTIIEKFSKLSLNPAESGFIGRKIGTSDGEYVLKSKYVMVEMADKAPEDAFPAGFEGVPVRDYIDSQNGTGTANSPVIEYKKTYSANEKKRKVYLGLNTKIGVDQDFFDYKGLPADDDMGLWTGRTDGFHLDSGTTSTVIEGVKYTLGDGSTYVPTFSFQTGNAEFRSELDLEETDYEKLNARKFTFAPYGGWDGWDVYRTVRTNDDRYRVNGTRGKQGLLVNTFENRVTSTQEDGIDSDWYAYFEGIRTYSNPEAVNINVFATPGIDSRDNISLMEEAIDMVEEERADSLYILTTPDTDSSGEVALTVGEAVDIIDDSGIDSNYSATYFPWLQMQDTENNQYVWLPPTLEVVRNIALTDNVAFPWFAAAGLNRGTTNAIKARTKLTLDQRDVLYEGRINPMATFSDVGVVIWGNKTLQSKDTALNRINVRRLLLQARKLISAVSIRLLFEQNDDVVRNQFLSLVNPILDNIRKERGLTDFRVQLDNDPEAIDRNELCGRIFIKPTRSLEFICVEFNITNTGANFDNL